MQQRVWTSKTVRKLDKRCPKKAKYVGEAWDPRLLYNHVVGNLGVAGENADSFTHSKLLDYVAALLFLGGIPRGGELVALKWSNIIFENERMNVTFYESKTNVLRPVTYVDKLTVTAILSLKRKAESILESWNSEHCPHMDCEFVFMTVKPYRNAGWLDLDSYP